MESEIQYIRQLKRSWLVMEFLVTKSGQYRCVVQIMKNMNI